MLSNRCIHILNEIAKSDQPLPISYLASVFSVSGRTVRYDLDEIDYFLKSKGFTPLCRRANKGVYHTGTQAEKTEILESAPQWQPALAHFSSVERRVIILTRRCLFIEDYTVESMAALLGVSISTVLNDLKLLRAAFADFGINFRNFKVTGNEWDIRDAIVAIYVSLLEKQTVFELCGFLEGKRHQSANQVFGALFEKTGIELLRQSIACVAGAVKTSLSSEALVILAARLCVQLGRIRCGKKLMASQVLYIFDDDVCTAAERIAHCWQQQGLEISRQEQHYLTQAVERTGAEELEASSSINMADLQMAALGIQQRVFAALGWRQTLDYELTQNLAEEIPQLIRRARLGVSPKKHFVRLAQEHYASIFKAVFSSAILLERLLGRSLKNDETAALAICFIDYYERSRTRLDRPKVILFGLEHDVPMKLVRRRLETLFAVDVAGQFAVYEQDLLAGQQADYVISLYNIPQTDIPHIHISPFLTPSDVATLKQYLPMALRPSSTAARKPVKPFASQLEAGCISLDDAAATLDEVIERAYTLLSENGCVTSGFLRDLYATANDIGLQSIMVPGMLFLHSRNFEYSQKTGMAVIRLKQPLVVQRTDTAFPVRYVFALSTADSQTHLPLLNWLVTVLACPKTLNKLDKALSPAAFIRQMEHAASECNDKEV